jgi:ribosome-binding protein aMBF1 (putative translation factor)
MTKYQRSRHVPLDFERSKAVTEELDDFLAEIEEAGQILKALREHKGWSVADLAKRVILVDKEHIEKMETGEQPIPLAVAKRFGKLFHKDYHLFL